MAITVPRRSAGPRALSTGGPSSTDLTQPSSAGRRVPSVRRVRLSPRRSDDADVIRARLRALLQESNRSGGWVPDDIDDAAPHEAAGPMPDEEDTRRTFPVPVPEPAPDAASGLPRGIGRHRSPGRTARWDPGRLGARSLWVAAVVAALVLVGWTWLDRPRVEPVPVTPAGTAAPTATRATSPVGEAAETTATVVVSVVGLVNRPGLVTLPSGSRVADAIEAAGGLLPGTDAASVNLAAVLSDGQQITVGIPGGAAPAGGDPSTAGGSGGRVDLNRATAADLDALPGIGPVLAQRIVDYREAHGPFRNVDQLDDVPGIGPAVFAQLADRVTV